MLIPNIIAAATVVASLASGLVVARDGNLAVLSAPESKRAVFIKGAGIRKNMAPKPKDWTDGRPPPPPPPDPPSGYGDKPWNGKRYVVDEDIEAQVSKRAVFIKGAGIRKNMAPKPKDWTDGRPPPPPPPDPPSGYGDKPWNGKRYVVDEDTEAQVSKRAVLVKGSRMRLHSKDKPAPPPPPPSIPAGYSYGYRPEGKMPPKPTDKRAVFIKGAGIRKNMAPKPKDWTDGRPPPPPPPDPPSGYGDKPWNGKRYVVDEDTEAQVSKRAVFVKGSRMRLHSKDKPAPPPPPPSIPAGYSYGYRPEGKMPPKPTDKRKRGLGGFAKSPKSSPKASTPVPAGYSYAYRPEGRIPPKPSTFRGGNPPSSSPRRPAYGEKPNWKRDLVDEDTEAQVSKRAVFVKGSNMRLHSKDKPAPAPAPAPLPAGYSYGYRPEGKMPPKPSYKLKRGLGGFAKSPKSSPKASTPVPAGYSYAYRPEGRIPPKPSTFRGGNPPSSSPRRPAYGEKPNWKRDLADEDTEVVEGESLEKRGRFAMMKNGPQRPVSHPAPAAHAPAGPAAPVPVRDNYAAMYRQMQANPGAFGRPTRPVRPNQKRSEPESVEDNSDIESDNEDAQEDYESDLETDDEGDATF